MGSGFVLKCKCCGFEESYFTGVGSLFPLVYRETVDDIKAGKYGEEWKNFSKKIRTRQ